MNLKTVTLLFLFPFYLLGQSGIVINEFMSVNESILMDEDGDYPDWIELYNGSSNSINLVGYGLSDKEDDPFKWIFPTCIIEPGEFKIIFASNKDYQGSFYLHTNFKISSSGEELLLTNPFGNLIDYINPTPLSENISFGRSQDGGLMFERLNQYTPEQSNSYSNGIIFSYESGFYDSTIILNLISKFGHDIRFSTDGSDPTIISTLFTDSLILTNLDTVENTYSNISTSPYWIAPYTNNLKSHVIKAATFNQGLRTSNIYTKIIFVSSNIDSNNNDLDIISIVSNPENLFSHDSGIYVPGINYDPSNSVWTGNYFQKGDLWERRANLQYFTSNGNLQFNQDVGIRIHGGKGRNWPQKSLRIYTEGDYGAPKPNYSFFDHLGQEKTIFDKLILRNIMSCWNNSVIKDEVTAYICKELNFEIQNFKPVLMFINGEYWGIQSIRDYFDEKYISENFDVEEDSVNIVYHGSGYRYPSIPDWGIDVGSNLGHIQLYDFLNNNNLSLYPNYEYIKSILDMESIIDYYCTEIYFNNKDWPTNNNKLWNEGVNGQWRQLFYDIDGGWQYLGSNYNSLSRALATNGSAQNSPYATFLLRKLFESQEFEFEFLNRMACLMKTTFNSDSVINKINYTKNFYINGMQEHVERWHIPNSISSWNSGVNGLITFANVRKEYVIQHINSYFGITFDPNNFICTSQDSTITDTYELEFDNQLRIYPNPSIERVIWIDFDFNVDLLDYEIFNISGKKIKSGTLKNHDQLITNFNSGIYYFSTNINQKKIVKKFVII